MHDDNTFYGTTTFTESVVVSDHCWMATGTCAGDFQVGDDLVVGSTATVGGKLVALISVADKDSDGDMDSYAPAAWQNKTVSNGDNGTIDWVVDFGLPEIPKMVFLKIDVRDSGSAAGGCRFQLRAKSTTARACCDAWAETSNNDWIRGTMGNTPVADNGTSYYNAVASGVDTMDVWIQCYAWVK
jgi:hypothetical protein